MRLVATRRLVPGMVIGQDVTTGRPGQQPLLRKGAVVGARYPEHLLKEGVNAVYVDDRLGEGIAIESPLKEETRREAERSLGAAFERIPELATGERLPAEAFDEFTRVAALIAADIASCDDAATALADLAAADAYTLQHSIDVTVLGLLIAKREFTVNGWIDLTGRRAFGKVEEKLARLGLGLMLHDVGKLTIPEAILHKPGPLDEDEWALMRRHPELGLELLASDLISALVKGVVRSHHERWDGSGYPDGRAGDKIFQFARIAAVADTYDAITSERPYAPAAPPRAAWDAIVASAGTAFDPQVVETFRAVVPRFPPGTELQLADGRTAVVVSVPPDDPEHPRVRLVDDLSELDLADDPELLPAAA